MSELSVSDFIKHNEKPKSQTRNVHVIVSGYDRDDRGVAYAVNGKNMLTGEDVKIRLASAEEYAKFYTSPKVDNDVRLTKAENAIKRRPSFAEFASARGARAVPENGVLTFSDVRHDSDGTLIGRWPNVVVNDPTIEAAVVCDYQIRTGIANKGTSNQKEIPYILAMFSREAISADEATPQKLERMFSGKLLDTQSTLQTNVTTVVGLKDGTCTFTFFPHQIKEEVNGKPSFRSPQNLQEAFKNTTITNSASLAAAAVIAAKAGMSFDEIKYNASKINENEVKKYRELFDGVKNDTIKAVFIPGASLHTSKFTAQAILGLKDDGKGNVQSAKTNESRINGAGYVSGVLGIRHTSVESGQTVPAIVKSLYTDNYVPNQDSDSFIRRETKDIGKDVFEKIYGEDQSAELNSDKNLQDGEDYDVSYSEELSDDEPSPF